MMMVPRETAIQTFCLRRINHVEIKPIIHITKMRNMAKCMVPSLGWLVLIACHQDCRVVIKLLDFDVVSGESRRADDCHTVTIAPRTIIRKHVALSGNRLFNNNRLVTITSPRTSVSGGWGVIHLACSKEYTAIARVRKISTTLPHSCRLSNKSLKPALNCRVKGLLVILCSFPPLYLQLSFAGSSYSTKHVFLAFSCHHLKCPCTSNKSRVWQGHSAIERSC